MTSWRIEYQKNAVKWMKSHKVEAVKFFKIFQEITDDFSVCQKYDIVTIKGQDRNLFRLRVGKYRAIFEIRKNELIILVINIDKRGDVYKSF